MVEQLRDEVRATRRALERQTLTAPAIDESIARAEHVLGRLPEGDRAAPLAPAVPVRWGLGDRARSRSGGWEGRITALERGGRRATLEAGGIRVTVNVGDLEPAVGNAGGGGSAGGGRDGWRTEVGRGPARRVLVRVGDQARPDAQRGVVTRPAGGTRGRGAGSALALPRRCVAGRPRQGDDHSRHGYRGAARRRSRGCREPPAREGPPARRTRRGWRRGDDRQPLRPRARRVTWPQARQPDGPSPI